MSDMNLGSLRSAMPASPAMSAPAMSTMAAATGGVASAAQSAGQGGAAQMVPTNSMAHSTGSSSNLNLIA